MLLMCFKFLESQGFDSSFDQYKVQEQNNRFIGFFLIYLYSPMTSITVFKALSSPLK